MSNEPCQHGRTHIVEYGWRGHRWLEVCKNCGQPFYVTNRNEIVPLVITETFTTYGAPEAPELTGPGEPNA